MSYEHRHRRSVKSPRKKFLDGSPSRCLQATGDKTKPPRSPLGKNRKTMKNLKLRIVRKIHDHTEYILNTTKAQRRTDRKARKTSRWANRLSLLADWKPFNWGWIRKNAQRDAINLSPEVRSSFDPEDYYHGIWPEEAYRELPTRELPTRE